MNNWATHELRQIDLGDQRLNQRLRTLVEALAARPEAIVPEATGLWAVAKAAYRFWDHDDVWPDAIGQAHCQAIRERLPAEGPILAVQDSTEFDFASHPATRNLG
jgi:hypothetical protein